MMILLKPLILFIVSSHTKLGDSDIPTGNFLPEVAHVYYQLKDDYTIVYASPAGGIPPIDPDYPMDPQSQQFLNDIIALSAFNNSIRLEDVVASDYVVVFYPGGHGPVFDLANNEKSHAIGREIYEAGGVIGAVCHGLASLVNLKLSNGSYLVAGKRVTGFSNAEEDAVNKSQYVPFLVESQLKLNGGLYSKATENFGEHVVVDGRLVTGQNPASATESGKAVSKLLTQRLKNVN